MRMNTTLIAGLFAGGVLGTIITGAFAFGPLDPPLGPVAPTGATLGDIRSDIAGLAAGLGGGPMSLAGTTTPIDDAFYFVEISGVPGEAMESYAQGWTDVEEFGDIGVQRVSQGAGAGRVEVSQEVTLVIKNGRALRSLRENVITVGNDITEINVRGFRIGGDPGQSPPRIYTSRWTPSPSCPCSPIRQRVCRA